LLLLFLSPVVLVVVVVVAVASDCLLKVITHTRTEGHNS